MKCTDRSPAEPLATCAENLGWMSSKDGRLLAKVQLFGIFFSSWFNALASELKANPNPSNLIGRLTVPCCGGWFHPTFEFQNPSGVKTASLVGPCWFISDWCGAVFRLLDSNGQQIGEIKKLPINRSTIMQELFTDADKFTLKFDPNASDVDKAMDIAALIYGDYQFFESGGQCGCQDGALVIKCCDLYCFGCLCPCNLVIGGNNGGGGGKPTTPQPEEMMR
eukprot:c15873_g1_i2.p1 GENE.c15873_g1_i2~~c15873_g1_i2.p1  ORF type:complete len:222 (+),score=48.67 c15873_g1_i2:268-933(+)